MKFTHKIKVAIVASVASLAIAGAAFAYFTTTGAGTGDGDVGTSSALVLYGVVTDVLYPGTESEVTFTVDNNSEGHQNLNDIHLVSITTPAVGCITGALGDFSMVDVDANQDLAPGDGTEVTATGTLVMANTATSQDACKSAVLTLNLTSN